MAWVYALRGGMVLLALFAGASRASATQITLTNGASSVTLSDGGVGDTCASADCVSFSGPLGNYIVNVSTGIQQDGTDPFLELNSLNVAFGGNAGVLTIAVSGDGYTVPVTQFTLGVGGVNGLGGSTSFAAYGGNSNTLFDTSHQLGSTLTFGAGVFAFADETTSAGNSLDPYSLTIVATINGVTPGAVSFDAAIGPVVDGVAPVPEPASLTLLGLGLAGMAGRRWRQRKRA